MISGGNDTGVYILNANSNTVQGNLIGVTAAGTASLSNINNGIIIYGSAGNLIGGATPNARNIVSGNGASGIYLYGPTTTGNLIQGNRIGTDISGSNAVANMAGDGITLADASANLISSNLVSGNGLAGISISGAAVGNIVPGKSHRHGSEWKNKSWQPSCRSDDSGATGNQIGRTNAGNVISGNVQDGIFLTGSATANVIQGNLIGLSIIGTNALRKGFTEFH